MAMDKLQLSLIGLGSLGLVALFGYSKWQDFRARRHAENVFGADHRDVLLDDLPPNSSLARGEPVLESPERTEPVDRLHRDAPPQPRQEMAAVNPEWASLSAEIDSISPTVLKSALQEDVDPEPQTRSSLEGASPLPQDVDPRVDCVVQFEPDSPITSGDVLAGYAQFWPQPLPGLRWYGLASGSAAWRPVGAATPGRFVKLVLALQLASREGAVGVDELSYLLEGATRFASHLGVATALPDARMVAHQAAELDRFCASVDVMIGVNVIAFDQPFPGTKIRGLAEAAGMKLGADGVYRAMDENGEEMFCLTSLEKPAFSQESLRNLQTRGLTLTLDVPRAAHGKQAFERMLMMARQLAETLKGRVVDDNQAPLADAALAVIREQIGGYQKQMQERALPPGSAVALRVFS